jgi:hypothetical protein
MHAQTGLAVQGKDFGLLSAAPAEPVQRRRAPKIARLEDQNPALDVEQASLAARNASEPDAEQIVKLGPVSSPYLLCAANSEASTQSLRVASHIWEEAQKVRATWPIPGQAITFAEKIVQFARAARGYNENGRAVGFKGGRDPDHGYTVKSLSRGMLIVAETMEPKLCDEDQLEKIQAFAPDVNKHTSCVGSWTGLQIRRQFALSPLMLSGYCCLAGWMDIAHLKQMLKFDDPKLMAGLHQWLQEKEETSRCADDYPFPPGPKALGQTLCQKMDS